ncbi:Gag-Pol polyprotein [Trachymyrmex cornetzi]|uniref:Gag-Pol polyprotein n=1 Tax=Trachymyrmex cornetzi TaxID=471704 RepID=A0A151JCM8_9HYME|nr:Gag-Pol polyprotein [Trachymyrmex cornetzi]
MKREPKCYNCNEMGHIATKCPKPKRGRRACFKCWQTGHQSKDCPSKEVVKNEASKDEGERKAVVNIVNSVINTDSGNFRRKVSYQLKNETEDFSANCELDTLLDTDSPISFMKDIFVPPNLVTPITLDNTRYYGLNNSELTG